MCPDLDCNQIAGMAIATVAILDLTSIYLKIGKFFWLVRDWVGKKLFKSCLIRTEIKDTFDYSQ